MYDYEGNEIFIDFNVVVGNTIFPRFKGFRSWDIFLDNVYTKKNVANNVPCVVKANKHRIEINDIIIDNNSYEVPVVNISRVGVDNYKWLDPVSNPISSRLHTRKIDNQYDLEIVTADKQKVNIVDGIIDVYGDLVNLSVINAQMSLNNRLYRWKLSFRNMPWQVIEWSALYHKARTEYYTSDARIVIPELYETPMLTVSQVDSLDDQWYFRDIDSEASDYVQLWEWLVTQPQIIIERNGLYDPKQRLIDIINVMNMGIDINRLKFFGGFRTEPEDVRTRMTADFDEKKNMILRYGMFNDLLALNRLDPHADDYVLPRGDYKWTERHTRGMDIRAIRYRLKDLTTQARMVELQDGVYIHNDSFEINIDTLLVHAFNVDIESDEKVSDKLYIPIKGIEEKKPTGIELVTQIKSNHLTGVRDIIDKVMDARDPFVEFEPNRMYFRIHDFTFTRLWEAKEVTYGRGLVIKLPVFRGLDIGDKLYIAKESLVEIDGEKSKFSFNYGGIVGSYDIFGIRKTESLYDIDIDNQPIKRRNFAVEKIDTVTNFYSNGVMDIVTIDSDWSMLRPTANVMNLDKSMYDAKSIFSGVIDTSGELPMNDIDENISNVYQPYQLESIELELTLGLEYIFKDSDAKRVFDIYPKPYGYIDSASKDSNFQKEIELRDHDSNVSKIWTESSSIDVNADFAEIEMGNDFNDASISKMWTSILGFDPVSNFNKDLLIYPSGHVTGAIKVYKNLDKFNEFKDGLSSLDVKLWDEDGRNTKIYGASKAVSIAKKDTSIELTGPIVIVKPNTPQYLADGEDYNNAFMASSSIYGASLAIEVIPESGALNLDGSIVKKKTNYNIDGTYKDEEYVIGSTIYNNTVVEVDKNNIGRNIKGQIVTINRNGDVWEETPLSSIYGEDMAIEIDLNFSTMDTIASLLVDKYGRYLPNLYGSSLAIEVDNNFSTMDEIGDVPFTSERDALYESSALRITVNTDFIDLDGKASVDNMEVLYNNVYNFMFDSDFTEYSFVYTLKDSTARMYTQSHYTLNELNIDSIDSMLFEYAVSNNEMRDINKKTFNNVKVYNSSAYIMYPRVEEYNFMSDEGVVFNQSLVNEFKSPLNSLFTKYYTLDYDFKTRDVDYLLYEYGHELKTSLISRSNRFYDHMHVDDNVSIFDNRYVDNFNQYLRSYLVRHEQYNPKLFNSPLHFEIPTDYEWDYNLRAVEGKVYGYSIFENKYGSTDKLFYDLKLTDVKKVMSTYLMNITSEKLRDHSFRVLRDNLGYDKSMSYEASWNFEWDIKDTHPLSPMMTWNTDTVKLYRFDGGRDYDHKHAIDERSVYSYGSWSQFNYDNHFNDVKVAINRPPYSVGKKSIIAGGMNVNIEPVWAKSSDSVDFDIMSTRTSKGLFGTPPAYERYKDVSLESFMTEYTPPMFRDQVKRCRFEPSLGDFKVARKEPGIYNTKSYYELTKWHDWELYEKYKKYVEFDGEFRNCFDGGGTYWKANKIEIKQSIEWENNHESQSFRIRGPYRWQGQYQDVKVYVADNEPTSTAWGKSYSADSILQGNNYHSEKDDKIVLTPLTGIDIWQQIDYWITNGPYANRYQIYAEYTDTSYREGEVYSLETTKDGTVMDAYEKTPYTFKTDTSYYSSDLETKVLEDKMLSNEIYYENSESYTYLDEIKIQNIRIQGEVFPLAAPINMELKGPINPNIDKPSWNFTTSLPKSNDWWKERQIMVFEKDNDRTSLFSNKVYLQ
jgi:hypothetical protein